MTFSRKKFFIIVDEKVDELIESILVIHRLSMVFTPPVQHLTKMREMKGCCRIMEPNSMIRLNSGQCSMKSWIIPSCHHEFIIKKGDQMCNIINRPIVHVRTYFVVSHSARDRPIFCFCAFISLNNMYLIDIHFFC